MESEDEAKAAIAALDGYSVKGSHIHVEVTAASSASSLRFNGHFSRSTWVSQLF